RQGTIGQGCNAYTKVLCILVSVTRRNLGQDLDCRQCRTTNGAGPVRPPGRCNLFLASGTDCRGWWFQSVWHPEATAGTASSRKTTRARVSIRLRSTRRASAPESCPRCARRWLLPDTRVVRESPLLLCQRGGETRPRRAFRRWGRECCV